MKHLRLLVFAVLLLAACAPAVPAIPESPAAVDTPAASPTSTANPPPAASKPAPAREVIAAAPTPETLEQEPVGKITLPVVKSTLPVARVTLPVLPRENTPQPGEIELIQKLYAQAKPAVLESHPSPDGQWTAQVFRWDCTDLGEANVNALDILKVTPKDGAEFTVDLQFQQCAGLGAVGLGKGFWSANSAYFYYTNARTGGPDGGCGPWYPPLIRYDPLTQVKQLLGNALPAPDSARIAAYQPDGSLWIWDAGQDVGRAVELPGAEAAARAAAQFGAATGVLAWEPDGSSTLAVLLSDGPCSAQPRANTRLFLVDAQTGAARLLLDETDLHATGLRWETPAALTLTGIDGQTWQVDRETGEVQE